jgi:salicylate hydroxylase
MIPIEAMMRDEETAKLMTSTDTQAWFGPGRFVVGYPISNNELFNLAMVAPRKDDTPVTSWNQPCDAAELRAHFSDFNPLVRKLTGLVGEFAKWTIAEIPELSTWSSRSGRTVLLGDAAHAMSPHAAQGGAMAMEDAAVLGEVLSQLETLEDLPRLADMYERLRRPRVARVAAIAKANGRSWMLPDGTEQIERDSRFKSVTDDYQRGLREIGREKMMRRLKVPADMGARWPQPAVLMWLYGYDARKAVESLAENSN